MSSLALHATGVAIRDPADALERARAVHNGGTFPVSTAYGWAGPGYGFYRGTGVSRRQLPKRERDGMRYGEPVECVGTLEALQAAAREAAA